MKKFSDFLAELETTDQIQKVELMNPAGEIVGLIENKPGSQGSVRVFNHLFKKWGSITKDAAKDGLKIYAEHTADAEDNPGKHTNIDRLLNVIETGEVLTVSITHS